MALCSPGVSGSETNDAAALGDAFPAPGAMVQQREN